MRVIKMLAITVVYEEFNIRSNKVLNQWAESWNIMKNWFVELCKNARTEATFLHYLRELFIVVGRLFEECEVLIYGVLKRPWIIANNTNMILNGKLGSFENVYKGKAVYASCPLTICSVNGLDHFRKQVVQPFFTSLLFVLFICIAAEHSSNTASGCDIHESDSIQQYAEGRLQTIDW